MSRAIMADQPTQQPTKISDDRRKALNLAITQIEKTCGKGSIMRMGADAPHVETHRRVELERPAATRRLGIAEHDPDLLAQLIDEDHRGARTVDRAGQLAQRLAHQARLQAGERDPLFRQAAEVCIQNQLGSTSLLQRRMSIGYGRAARIIDQLELAGVLGPANGSKPRDVLLGLEELDELTGPESANSST